MIRKIKNSDREFIIKVIEEEFHVVYKKDTPFTNWYIYEENNAIVGFINIDIMYEKAQIAYLYVDPEYRRQHIATKLLFQVEQNLKNRQVENITLEVDTSNISAISFYQKNGFKKVSIRKQYYGTTDAYLMLKELVIK